MERRKFLQLSIALTAFNSWAASCKKGKKIKGKILGSSASIGHMLRDHKFKEPELTEQKDIVIIGGGVSGLSAARFLKNSGLSDFAVLDLEQKMGGNSVHGKNDVSAYPWGAHYIPIPNNTLTEYLDFLKGCEVITGLSKEGLPFYNEYYQCFDPQDRLYINGRWQEGLVPHFGVPDEDLKQIDQFLQLMNELRYKKGGDGKDAFSIPVDTSSKDEVFTSLDNITMKEWLFQKGFTSDYLHWYIDYCTRDDFGTALKQVSAWAGIHYFASRKGKGANAEPQDVLTWPEGNGWLVQRLQKDIKPQLMTGALVLNVQEKEDNVHVDYLDIASKQLRRIIAKQCIMAAPQFIASRLLKDNKRIGLVQQNFNYMPWMVANLTVSKLEERSGASMSWDNVLYGSDSLGYVEATHELVAQHVPRKNLTYYLPLTNDTVVKERKAALHKGHTEWVKIIMDDLKKVHPNIEEATEEVNIMVWGHAMVQPLPGYIHGTLRKELAESINNRIHFAHTDLAGISIFEEGFYQGLNAAKKVIAQLS